MVFQLVQSAYIAAINEGGGTQSMSFTNPIGPGNMVVGAVAYYHQGTPAANSITDSKGNIYTLAGNETEFSPPLSNSDYTLQMFYGTNIPSKPQAMTCSFTTNGLTGFWAAEFTPSGYFEVAASSSNTDQNGINASNIIAVSQGNSLCVGLTAEAFVPNATLAPAAGGNWISILRDVSAQTTIGPAVNLMYQVIPAGSNVRAITTGGNVNDVRAASLVLSMSPNPVFKQLGQACVG
jgi:hypothetical protein